MSTAVAKLKEKAVYTVGFVSPGSEPHGRLGQYRYIWAKRSRKIDGKSIVFAIYGAYDAMGLIGSEENGIVVLDDTNKRVICDKIWPAPSGYYGASAQQTEQFMRMVHMHVKEFKAFVRSNPRFRKGTL